MIKYICRNCGNRLHVWSGPKGDYWKHCSGGKNKNKSCTNAHPIIDVSNITDSKERAAIQFALRQNN